MFKWNATVQLNAAIKTVALGLLLAGTMAAKQAEAAIISLDLDVSVTNFNTPGTAPVEPAEVRFTIVFDNSIGDILNETNGINLVSSNIALGGVLSFNYSPGPDILQVGVIDPGGTSLGTTTSVILGMDDFLVSFSGISSSPSFLAMNYSQQGETMFFTSVIGAGSVVAAPFSVPEPATLSVMGFGVASLAALRRWRRKALGTG